jgi:transglutaminase-like putative cysteine protease
MKARKHPIAGILILFAAILFNCQESYQSFDGKIDLSRQKKLYYGIKINKILCGYSEIGIRPIEKEGKKFLQIDDHSFVMVSALGSRFNSEIHSIFHVDSISGQFQYQKNHIKQANMDFTVEATVKNDTILINSTLAKKTSKIAVSPKVILRNNQFFPFLAKDFSDSSAHEKTYEFFEIKDQEIQKTTYKRLGEEKLKLAGATFEALVLEEMNQRTGHKVKWWLDKQNGYLLKMMTIRGETFLADAGVANKIKPGTMDDLILQKTNVSIADFQAISYMKVKARLEPSGLLITPQSLNVPGQKFTGTVKNNVIEGVFEIEHRKYNGINAPDFPPNFSEVDSVKEFLRATDIIEADDPLLIQKAKEITAGAKDSWEAAVSLSRWVADSIGYAIPGGATARHTYDIRKGECGAHSILLAAFCRAVGIPARMAWGCMYVPNLGGAFGQHGWTEIYMGEAGWIPVDATTREPDYVDSGHLRLGHFQSLSIALNPEEMEVLDYRLGSDSVKTSAGNNERYQPYLGKYTGRNTFIVSVQNGQLTAEIPDRTILALNDPDENNIWFAKISSNIFFEFSSDPGGDITEMILHEIVSLPRKANPDAGALEDVPEQMRPYVGIYDFPQANAELRVFCKNRSLVIHNPLEKRDIKLLPPDERGRWKDEFKKNEIFFERGADGEVSMMKIDAINRFSKED